ncbi:MULTISPECIES: putative quinol monooxygenase [Actinomycetes]|uniref:putative quinol monooxygenase n=1 Tax=Actinomycetes TaxID=1760 RepID=UPI000944AC61|nr:MULTISPECIES: antibiotic biosynthesis monooxygenase [Actinomycetes]QDX76615.1 antibiotic biosynthesis monooxygenase [Corynebacterium glutamicum]QDX79392.1 antibiotic biosynthesis monooxygenase [Corynebacterium glutamicum]QYR17277.1 antibiotic biosynthesis monooxygenase [Corynebacterium glutamicum]TWS42576.1 antibiotic biosynthesis monooxygenase [Corynebacterium glutamicum]TWS44073.1 antibiotic biosynthesis monooxygenase [Corynebacterium glutamicum]
MGEVQLTGRLVCRTTEESNLVKRFLHDHVSLTRLEPGCLSFEVTQTDDPLVWRVEERFNSEAAFECHQDRVASSEWGRMTAGITRDYSIVKHTG